VDLKEGEGVNLRGEKKAQKKPCYGVSKALEAQFSKVLTF
jgi:hypothetical protein